jgi:hypothetical protein
VGHTVRRCPQPEGSGENEYGGDNDAAGGFGGDFGHDDTQQVADQLAQLSTDQPSDDLW